MITINHKQIMVEHYSDIIHVASKEIKIKMKNNVLIITGTELKVVALSKYEILLEGNLKNLEFQYEK